MITDKELKLLRQTFSSYEQLVQSIELYESVPDPTVKQIFALIDARVSAEKIERIFMKMITLNPVEGT